MSDLETAYLDAREADDRRIVARLTGGREVEVDTKRSTALAALRDLDRTALASDDIRAVATMEAGLARIGETTPERRVDTLEAAYARTADALAVGGERVSRLTILGRLAREPRPAARRELFMALEPLWHVVDGDGGPTSSYRALIATSTTRAGGPGYPVVAWCEAILDAWRDAADATPVEPWDWWWVNGELERRLAPLLPVERLRPISDAYHAALGADVVGLGVVYDLSPRHGRPALPLAETVFGARPRRLSDGSWSTGRPTVLATYVEGGLGELIELIHETGHAIHIGAIRTRPAYTDWPDSDALSEAIADVLAWDTPRPEWLRRWVSPDLADIPSAAVARASFAGVAMDAAWALLEVRLLADPTARPNDVWTDITMQYLRIAPHAEWSWWAIRGQLVQEPGYMVNYAIGAVLAADLRAAIRAARGDWIDGDPGWYDWVSEHLYRFGLEVPSDGVVRRLIGRAPSPDALLEAMTLAD